MTRSCHALIVITTLMVAACAPSGPSSESRTGPSAHASARPAVQATPDVSERARPEALASASADDQGRPRIVFLGDSLTSGYGLPSTEQAVPALIQEMADRAGYSYEVVNAGVSGDTTAGGLSRLEWSLQGRVEVLVIELGANDGLRGLPVAELERNLSAIIAQAQKRGIRVLLTGMEAPPNFGPVYTREFRQVYRHLATRYDVPLVPFYLEGVAGNTALNIADGIHPNAQGAHIVARTVWGRLEPLLEKPRS